MSALSRLEYQRIIVGYHGCDKTVAMKVLQAEEHLKPSDNNFDWLGKGVYFWEHAPRRALQFAREQKGRQKIDNPMVLGAYINLGRCFDLTDIEHTEQLTAAFERLSAAFDATGTELPENKAASGDDHDLLLRYRDCAVLNWYMKRLDKKSGNSYAYQTVRGVFQEGNEAFDGSKIMKKSHIQIAVRDPACIIGYFLPTTFFDNGDDK